MPEPPPWSTELKYSRVASGDQGWGRFLTINAGQSDEQLALQITSLSYPVIKNSLTPNSFLDKNTGKFFPQANLSVQIRDREVTCLSALRWFDRTSESLVKMCRVFVREAGLSFFHSCHMFRSLAPFWENISISVSMWKLKLPIQVLQLSPTVSWWWDEIDFASETMKRKSVRRNDTLWNDEVQHLAQQWVIQVPLTR